MYAPYIPKSTAFAELSFATFMFTSAIATVDDDTVVVVPETVKSPVTVKSFPIVTSFGKPIVTSALSEPEPDISTSFAVPVIDCT